MVKAGIEGTFSQGVRSTGLRRSRYRGRVKTHLQNVAGACAINLQHLTDRWSGGLPAQNTHLGLRPAWSVGYMTEFGRVFKMVAGASMGILRLGGVVYRAIRVHSEQPWPHECCGALPGKSEAEG